MFIVRNGPKNFLSSGATYISLLKELEFKKRAGVYKHFVPNGTMTVTKAQ